MPVIKISLNDDYYEKIINLAKEEGISVQDYIRNKVFEETSIYTPAYAVKLALENLDVNDVFTLPSLYSEYKEWNIKRGVAGVFGKQFFNYVEEEYQGIIEFNGMADYNRHASYKILKKEY